jgi:serine/threonine protein kinase
MLRSGAPGGALPLSVEGSSSGSAPETFGPFRVLHQLGAGTLGPVFRAHDPVEGRLVSIKAFRLDLTPERAADLARELEALVGKRLTHPSIAAPLAAGLEGSTPWLAQTYAPAESLDGALRQYGPAPTAHVVTVVTHLAGALDFAAAAGVLHGCLHPRDVLVAPDETFLIDVGVAPALERCGIRAPVRRPYSAPERVTGGPASRPADIFALAAVGFELLVGQPIAGPGDSAAATLPDIVDADNAALKQLFAAALATDPAERPETALQFASAFKTALGSASFRTTPAVAPRRPKRQTPTADQMLPLGEADRVLPSIATQDDAAVDTPPVSPLDRATLHRTDADSPHGREEAHEEGGDLRVREPGRPITGSREPTSGSRILSTTTKPQTRASVRSAVSVRLIAALIGLAMVVGFGIGWVLTRLDRVAQQSAVKAPSEPTEDRAPSPTETTGASVPRAETEDVIPETPPVVSAPIEVPSAPPRAVASPAPTARRPEPPAQTLRGRLLVRSTPAGASVSVNGRTRGDTPLALRDLPLGGHTVVVSRPGYAPERRRVTLTRNRVAQTLDVPLRATTTRAAGAAVNRPDRSRDDGYTGTVVFESRPTGARVVLDGREVGRTPLVLPSVRAGSHVVRLELAGHRTWTAAVRVIADDRTRIAASLEELTQ